MLTVPAFVWRGGFLYRTTIIGGCVGLGLGVLAWIDSGFLPAGVAVLVIVGPCHGIWMARRMARLWPANKELSGADRVSVARAVRRGERLHDERLVDAANGYRAAMHTAAETARRFRWFLMAVLAIAVVTAAWDAKHGTVGNAVVSVIYLALLLIEFFWWPKRQAQLLANVDRACG